MNRLKKAAVVFLAFAFLTTIAAVPVMAAKPTVVPCNFVLVAWSNLEAGKIWYSDDGPGKLESAGCRRLLSQCNTSRILNL